MKAERRENGKERIKSGEWKLIVRCMVRRMGAKLKRLINIPSSSKEGVKVKYKN